MKRQGRALVLVLGLASCSPPAPAEPEALDLTCTQPFEALKAAVVSQTNLRPAPYEPAEPYRFYSTHDGRASYLITEPAAPGHPAIMMQKVRGSEVVTTGCPYGDKARYD